MIRRIKSLIGPLSPIRLFANRGRSVLAAWKYRFPAKDFKVIAVTGTDGKSTTSYMITRILETAGLAVGSSSSLDFRIMGETIVNKTKMTTASPEGFNKLLRRMKKSGVEHLVLEITSHGLMQWRMFGINPEVAVFTNLSREHLDYHGDMNHYMKSKRKLFEMNPRVSVLNYDSEYFDDFNSAKSDLTMRYSLSSNNCEIYASDISLKNNSSQFKLHIGNSSMNINLGIPGEFNIYNALAAASACFETEVLLEDIKKGLESIKGVAGRMQLIDCGQDFDILIDYAVTPASLETLYKTISQTCKGKIIHVFGSCGDRDKGKRPIMGSLVGRSSDICIVTNEDPYTEDPKRIMDEVYSGVLESGAKDGINSFLIEDRFEAIKKALDMAKPGDLVVLTGKGSETSMQLSNKRIPWSEEGAVRKIMGDLK